MTTRRASLAVLMLAPLLAAAQQRIVRIGFLAPSIRLEPFRQGMRQLGYVEGKNLAIDSRWDANYERLGQIAGDMVRAKVDLFVTGGTPAALAAKKATSTIPIVMGISGDALATGLVDNLARPGGNLTGSTFFAPELEAKQLDVLREVLPRAKRIAAMVNSANAITPALLKNMSATCERLGLAFQAYAVKAPADFAAAFDTMVARRTDAVLLSSDGVLITNAKLLADLALKHRLPAFGPTEIADAGAFMAYSVDLDQFFRRSAVFVDKILKGARPGDLPIDQATRFLLVINLKTAKALGIPLSRDLLARADRVVE
jgi:putative ABC transport system substrate-binding protein